VPNTRRRITYRGCVIESTASTWLTSLLITFAASPAGNGTLHWK
jgi:hypothetical protein